MVLEVFPLGQFVNSQQKRGRGGSVANHTPDTKQVVEGDLMLHINFKTVWCITVMIFWLSGPISLLVVPLIDNLNLKTSGKKKSRSGVDRGAADSR